MLLAAPQADAKRHGHGHHRAHGWMQVRVARLRGWFGRVAHDPKRTARVADGRQESARREREAMLAARRRADVAAYLRDHPTIAFTD